MLICLLRAYTYFHVAVVLISFNGRRASSALFWPFRNYTVKYLFMYQQKCYLRTIFFLLTDANMLVSLRVAFTTIFLLRNLHQTNVSSVGYSVWLVSNRCFLSQQETFFCIINTFSLEISQLLTCCRLLKLYILMSHNSP